MLEVLKESRPTRELPVAVQAGRQTICGMLHIIPSHLLLGTFRGLTHFREVLKVCKSPMLSHGLEGGKIDTTGGTGHHAHAVFDFSQRPKTSWDGEGRCCSAISLCSGQQLHASEESGPSLVHFSRL